MPQDKEKAGFFQPDDAGDFPADVMAEVAEIHIEKKDLKDRPYAQAMTISESMSVLSHRGFIAQRTQQGYFLSFSVVDAASFLSPNTAIDREALQRIERTTTSDGKVRPMLPPAIFQEILKLQEGRDTPTITVSLPITNRMEIGVPTFALTKVASLRNFNYEEADQVLFDPHQPLNLLMKDLQSLAEFFYLRRKTLGATAFYDLKAKKYLSADGGLKNFGKRKEFNSFIIQQELNIFFNQLMTNYLREKNIPLLFRNQLTQDETTYQKPVTTLEEAVEYGKKKLHVKYSPFPQGHLTLNVPAYTRFDLPLLHYPDLVNQRILLAAIRGEKIPYTVNQLKEIAGHLNKRFNNETSPDSSVTVFQAPLSPTEELEKGTESVQRPASFSLEEIREADEDRFLYILRQLKLGGHFSSQQVRQIRHRITKHDLGLPTMFYILFEPRFSNESQDWNGVLASVLTQLSSRPENAISLIAIATQKPGFGWSTPLYQETFHKDAKLFGCAATLEVNGRHFVSPECTSTRKKKAKQLATCAVLGQALGLEAFIDKDLLQDKILSTEVIANSPQEVERSEEQFDDQVANRLRYKPANYKGMLGEYANKLQLPHSVFLVRAHLNTLKNDTTFTAVVRLKLPDREIESERMFGKTKKEAEHQAAANLLEQLNILHFEAESHKPILDMQTFQKKAAFQKEVIRDNYISALQNLSAKLKGSNPTYSHYNKGLDFIYSVQVEIAGKMHEALEVARSPRDAKKKAAKALFLLLVAFFEDTSK